MALPIYFSNVKKDMEYKEELYKEQAYLIRRLHTVQELLTVNPKVTVQECTYCQEYID